MSIAPHTPRILVVDDNRDAADSTVALLRLAGCEASACYDGPSALALAEQFRPTVCLLDLDMPVMPGDALGRKLREQAATAGRLPPLLVALTAYGDLGSRRRTAAAGCVMHLVKPMAASDLVLVTTSLGRDQAADAGGGSTPDCNAGSY